ncbi:hypothetical protein GCM10009037_04040 [Halarchaeum grantii]|uniref:Integral membrane protein n=1 Tax=Halarchaeum grantii TaxID=1193105 RepID=A0A830ES19_9EURY|nr:DUF2391 domain-containing protein [Halarchaeum grantii]GGL23660.1 hypothetical protein GCM10009037_04040 [Halarchaeum grantii]
MDENEAPTEGPDVSDLMDRLESLEAHVDSPEALEAVQEAMETASELEQNRVGTFGRVIHGFDRADAAEAGIGGALFAVPMVVEGGTYDVGAFVATHPIHLLATVVATVATVYGILYVAEIQDVRVKDPLFGLIPRRLAGVVTISFTVTAAIFTGWGQAQWASDPWLTLCIVGVAWAPTAVGAALGDILPGS